MNPYVQFYYTKNNQQYWVAVKMGVPKIYDEYGLDAGELKVPIAIGKYAPSKDLRVSRRTGKSHIGYDEALEIDISDLPIEEFNIVKNLTIGNVPRDYSWEDDYNKKDSTVLKQADKSQAIEVNAR